MTNHITLILSIVMWSVLALGALSVMNALRIKKRLVRLAYSQRLAFEKARHTDFVTRGKRGIAGSLGAADAFRDWRYRRELREAFYTSFRMLAELGSWQPVSADEIDPHPIGQKGLLELSSTLQDIYGRPLGRPAIDALLSRYV